MPVFVEGYDFYFGFIHPFIIKILISFCNVTVVDALAMFDFCFCVHIELFQRNSTLSTVSESK